MLFALLTNVIVSKQGGVLKLFKIGFTYKSNGSRSSLYYCSCGKYKRILDKHVISKRTMSCGCLKSEGRSGLGRVVYKTRLYRIWIAMKQRCLNENNTGFKNYGGRGIQICDDWLNSFKSFHDWAINNGYADDLQIDRIDNDLHYTPENCQWLTPYENTMKMLTSNREQGIGQFSTETIDKITVINRLQLGRKFHIIKDDVVVFTADCLNSGAVYINGVLDNQYDLKSLRKNISACLSGKRKRCAGYTFRELEK